MSSRAPWELSVVELSEAIDAGQLAPPEVLESCLARINAYEDALGAWEHIDAEGARVEARSARPGPLHGIPAGIKDIFNTRDMPTTMGSPAWASFTPGNDARVVHYARRAGTVVVGKTVTAEFAVHAPGKTRNPHDLSRSPGTSSSGSAAAVACGMVPWALGSQTAGSIVRPASYVGIYGFKPSYGSIARIGMLKTTDTLDQIGLFTRSVHDLSRVFDALRVHGADYPLVHTTLDQHQPVRFLDRKPRIGLVTDALDVWELATDESRMALLEYAQQLEAGGVEVVEAAPPDVSDANAIHETIYNRCIAYYFDREAREGTLVSDVIREMWERGHEISVDEYQSALARQAVMQREVATFSANFDALLTLSTAGPAPLFGEADVRDSALIWSLAGASVVSAPLFHSEGGLPFGAQFVGARFRDYELLDLLEWLESGELLPVVSPIAVRTTEVV